MSIASPGPTTTTRCDVSSRGTALARLTTLVRTCRSPQAVARESLPILAEAFHASYAALHAGMSTGTLHEQWGPEEGRALWSRLAEGALLEASRGHAIGRLYEAGDEGHRFALLAVPVRTEDRVFKGGLVLVTPCDEPKELPVLLADLRSASALLGIIPSLLVPATVSGSAADATLKALARSADYHSLSELAFAITNGIKSKFECDLVVLGKVRGKHVQVLSISGMDNVFPRTPGTHLIRQAMEECLDVSDTIVCQPGGGWATAEDAMDYRLHRQWRAAVGDGAVVSVPLELEERVVAVLSVVRRGDAGFSSAEVQKIREAILPFAAALPMVDRASRSWRSHSLAVLRHGLTSLLRPGGWGRKLLVAAAVVFSAWFCLGTLPYRISVPCEIEAGVLRHFAAPYQGPLRAAYVENGDTVAEGTLLYEMDTEELEARQRQLQADLAVTELELTQALSDRRLSDAALAAARQRVWQVQAESVARMIGQARVVAPCDGTIVSGQIRQRVGETLPLGTPLLVFAPDTDWLVKLHVPEAALLEMPSGCEGTFAALARPSQRLALRVRGLQVTAEPAQGKNSFTLRADVQQHPAWMRPGMQGVATLELGTRRVWWIALHRLVDFLRLHTHF